MHGNWSIAVDDIAAAFASILGWRWLAALLFIGISFRVIGTYDIIWHKILATGVPNRDARNAGMAAIALGQTIGAGAVSGALIRWRTIPDLTLPKSTHLSVAITSTFLLLWAVLALIACSVLGILEPAMATAFVVACSGAINSAARLTGGRIRLPDTTQLLQLAACVAADLVFAGSALFLLIGPSIDVTLGQVIAVYALALGFGLLSNVPAGAGVFEIAVTSLLPVHDPVGVLAALCAFRLAGYLLPAALALIWLWLRPDARPRCPQIAGEWGLSHQDAQLVRSDGATWLMGSALGMPVILGDPDRDATYRGLHLAQYKINSRRAHDLRKRGWCVARIGSEAWLAPKRWSPVGREFTGLRRKLRQAESAGVTITEWHGEHPEALAQVAAEWSRNHGGERGFSMGLFDIRYLRKQRVFMIRQDGALTGFASFHVNSDSWHLDLVRSNKFMADGAMHAAIIAAIEQAACSNVARLSLAAVSANDLSFRFARRAEKTCAGLAQFKGSFRPFWRPVYFATPNRAVFPVALCAVTLAVQRPIGRLPQSLGLKFRIAREKRQGKAPDLQKV